jgi:hypothetical protein
MALTMAMDIRAIVFRVPIRTLIGGSSAWSGDLATAFNQICLSGNLMRSDL